MSPAHISFDEAGALGEKLPEEVKGFRLVGEDKEVEIDLDDEPEPLLNFLNAWREKVAMRELSGIPMLSYPVELKLLDLLTSQLDSELISHNMTVAGLRKRGNGVLQKGRELLEANASLRGER